jgi:maleamate amidohydrolase
MAVPMNVFGRDPSELLVGTVPMLLVVDIANAWSRSDSALCAMSSPEIIDNTNRAIAAFREEDRPIVFTTMAYECVDEFGPAILKRKPILRTLRFGNEATSIDGRVDFRQGDDRLFRKTRSSCFSNGDLIGFAMANRIDTVVVVGMTTSGCIRSTVVAAYDLNLYPVVLADCVSDRSESAHQASLSDMRTRYSEVLDVDGFLHHVLPRMQ